MNIALFLLGVSVSGFGGLCVGRGLAQWKSRTVKTETAFMFILIGLTLVAFGTAFNLVNGGIP